MHEYQPHNTEIHTNTEIDISHCATMLTCICVLTELICCKVSFKWAKTSWSKREELEVAWLLTNVCSRCVALRLQSAKI